MGIVLNSGYLQRTTGLLDHNATYTVLGWVYLNGIVGSEGAQTIWSSVDLDTSATRSDFVGVEVGAAPFRWWVQSWDGTTITNAYSTDSAVKWVGSWVHIALVRTSVTALSLYIQGELVATATTATVASTPATTRQSYARYNGEFPSQGTQSAARFLEYNAALSESDIRAQMNSTSVVRSSNLFGQYNMATAAAAGTDSSGNGRNYTATTVTTFEDPPIYRVSTTPYARDQVSPGKRVLSQLDPSVWRTRNTAGLGLRFYWVNPGQGLNADYKALENLRAWGVTTTIIPLAISLGSANRAVTMSSLVDLNPSISLGSANRAVTMSSLIDVNLSVSLGSANRAVTMGVESGFLLPLSISLGSANRSISTSTLVAVPVPASLGSANRTMSAAAAISLLRSISLGSTNRTVTMSNLVDLNPSISLGSANRAVTMDSLVKPSPAISLGSANRTVTMGTLIALTQSITYPRNSFISMAANPNALLPLLVPWTGAITMGVFVDNGSGSNPQVDGSVAKVTGCGLTIIVTTNSAILFERAVSLGMAITIIIPASLNLGKTMTIREVQIPEEVINLGSFRKEDQSYIDRLSPGELLEIRGIPANSTGV